MDGVSHLSSTWQSVGCGLRNMADSIRYTGNTLRDENTQKAMHTRSKGSLIQISEIKNDVHAFVTQLASSAAQ